MEVEYRGDTINFNDSTQHWEWYDAYNNFYECPSLQEIQEAIDNDYEEAYP